jgi:hypothetical protein
VQRQVSEATGCRAVAARCHERAQRQAGVQASAEAGCGTRHLAPVTGPPGAAGGPWKCRAALREQRPVSGKLFRIRQHRQPALAPHGPQLIRGRQVGRRLIERAKPDSISPVPSATPNNADPQDGQKCRASVASFQLAVSPSTVTRSARPKTDQARIRRAGVRRVTGESCASGDLDASVIAPSMTDLFKASQNARARRSACLLSMAFMRSKTASGGSSGSTRRTRNAVQRLPRARCG